MDDISLPPPPMATPDLRQTMLEVARYVRRERRRDDIHLIGSPTRFIAR
ncbi:MAG: hypothetical protein IPJ30_23995 [Acidobacteria bacterium]|nr:hypothetical protein [Acidobacteriota bacterium]